MRVYEIVSDEGANDVSVVCDLEREPPREGVAGFTSFTRMRREVFDQIRGCTDEVFVATNDPVQGARGEDDIRSKTAGRVLPCNGLFVFAFLQLCDSVDQTLLGEAH